MDESQWNNVLAQSSCATVFHRSGWLRAIEDGLYCEPRHIVVRKKENPIAVFPNFVSDVAIPFDVPIKHSKIGLGQLMSVTPGFGGPIIASNRRQSFEAIFEVVDSITDWNVIAHRMRILDSDHIKYGQKLHAKGYTPSLQHCRLQLKLDDYDRILDDMDKERRKEIRRVQDGRTEVVEEEVSRKTMREFYSEYLKTIQRVDGIKYPLSFFLALADYFADRIKIFAARADGQTVGKHLYLLDEEQDSLHYFFAGIDKEHFKYDSPTVLHDHAIRWSIENDYATYDFGESDANHQDGVFRYKRKFGAEAEPIYEWERGHAPLRWWAFRVGRQRHFETEM